MKTEIKTITPEDLRTMQGQEGLILQGCGGALSDWVNGINQQLTDLGILLDGDRLEDVMTFSNEDLTCLFFRFGSQHMDTSKLAVWRLQTYSEYGGTWLSDYVPNYLGGFLQPESSKPDCELIGQDGNIFNLMGLAARTLRQHGLDDQAQEMSHRITGGQCHSYYEALGIIGEYVNITGPESEEIGPQLS